jgi:hypothetical protein
MAGAHLHQFRHLVGGSLIRSGQGSETGSPKKASGAGTCSKLFCYALSGFAEAAAEPVLLNADATVKPPLGMLVAGGSKDSISDIIRIRFQF